MKKLLLLIVSLLALATLTACGTSAPAGKLTIGTPPLNGDFVTGFSNSAYDRMVTDMIWGYATYDYTDKGEFVLDKTVVKEEKVTLNDDKSKTYTFTIHKDLKWSDETPITAKDYVFGLLLTNSPAWGAVTDGNNMGGNSLVGWEAFGDEGATQEDFTGVKLIDDYTFSMTIKAEELPYFYEASYVAASPSPMHVYAPGATIEADSSKMTWGGETADYAAAVKRVSDTERYAPTVTSGMYKFVKYENETVELEVNTQYKGDYRGKKPSIKNVEVSRVNEKLDVQYVLNGDIDITTGVVEGEKIKAALAAKEEGKANVTTYERNGYGFLAFHNDFGPVADPVVRQAFAHLVDRNVFVDQILEGYGVVVNGMYGLGQWMYEKNKEAMENDLIDYVYNVEKANELLDTTDYKFEKDGTTAFDASKASADYIRYNSKGEGLEINHAGSENNPITDLIASDVVNRMTNAGIKFTVDFLDFNVMLPFYYGGAAQVKSLGYRKYHTFNLASTFTAVFDPYTSLHSDYFGTPYNATQTKDAKFDELIMTMRRLEGTQKEEFSKAWLEFQKYWNENLPQLPLYSNKYYDIYGPNLENVNTTPFYGIGRAIIDIKLK